MAKKTLMKTNNLWEADQLRKLTTVFAVDQQMIRCEKGMKAAPSVSKVKEWGRKLLFLTKLKQHVAMGGSR